VTLTIGGTRTVTLREGESAGDIEVQLILPELVYVHVVADVFALGAEP
jgi:hypothetical protein